MTVKDAQGIRALVRTLVKERALSRSCPGLFLNKWDLVMAFVRRATEEEYVHRMREMLRTDIFSKSDLVNLSRCCLPRPCSLFCLIRDDETWRRDMELEVGQKSKALHVGWHDIELFAVPPAEQALMYALTPAFWSHLESPGWLLVATPLCHFYFSGLLARHGTSLTGRVSCHEMVKFLALSIGELFRTVLKGVLPSCDGASMEGESDLTGVIGPLGLRAGYWC